MKPRVLTLSNDPAANSASVAVPAKIIDRGKAMRLPKSARQQRRFAQIGGARTAAGRVRIIMAQRGVPVIPATHANTCKPKFIKRAYV